MQVIRGESKIIRSIVGVPNVVQFHNIFETHKFICIHMEHLKGNSMKLHIKKRLAWALKNMNVKSRDISDDDSDGDYSQINSGQNIFTKFNDPIKFWKHQLSFKRKREEIPEVVTLSGRGCCPDHERLLERVVPYT